MEGGAAAVLPNEEVCELKPGWEEVAGATTENEEAKVSLTLNAAGEGRRFPPRGQDPGGSPARGTPRAPCLGTKH
ncbi:unnamed protein product [Caretta caretta]